MAGGELESKVVRMILTMTLLLTWAAASVLALFLDPYKTLNVRHNAKEPEIRSAYRKLALVHHPDKGGSEETFARLADAYGILSDPIKRRRYDAGGYDDDGSGHNM